MQLYLCEKPSQRGILPGYWGSAGGERAVLKGYCHGHLGCGASAGAGRPGSYGEQFGVPWRMESLPVLPENGR